MPGLEHGVVSLQDGTRWMVRGGSTGIDFSKIDDLRRTMAHTHGMPTGPSGVDFDYLINNNNMRNYRIEVGSPKEVIRFNKDRTWWNVPVE